LGVTQSILRASGNGVEFRRRIISMTNPSSGAAAMPCAEKQVLVRCARSPLRPSDAQEIRRLAEQTLDWDYLLSEAAENSIVPLVSQSLREAAEDLIPAAIAEQLKEASRANSIRCLYYSAELARILQLFRSESIRGIPYKGPVLAAQAYGDVTLREFEDLDIILPQSDLPRAHAILQKQGYDPRFPWILSKDAMSALVPGEYNYRDKSRRVMVELHTELTLRHFPVVPDIPRLAEKVVPINVAGAEIVTFSPETTFVLLCLHGSKDFWERLSWVADIAEMAASHPTLDWEEIYRLAESLRSTRILHLGIGLAADLLEAKFPAVVGERAGKDSAAADLARRVSNRLLAKDFPHLNSLGRFEFRRRLVPGGWQGMRYSARLTLVPTEDDWEMVQLPPALSPLYLLLRPLRLLRKYGVRSAATESVAPPTAARKS
jgi:hypothetical protein